MDLVPCVHCHRHVGVSETKCPFCRRSLSAQRPQFALARKLTRAAIFSAAVVACDSKSAKPSPAPPPPPQAGSATGSGSEDIEKMLDADQGTVDHQTAVTDAGAADAEAMAAVADAGLDAGVAKKVLTPEEIKERREKVEKDTDLVRQKVIKETEKRQNQTAKPYGAPPARRRVV